MSTPLTPEERHDFADLMLNLAKAAEFFPDIDRVLARCAAYASRLLAERDSLERERDEARACLLQAEGEVRSNEQMARRAFDDMRGQRDGWHKAAEKRARRIVELECERNAIARAALALLEDPPAVSFDASRIETGDPIAVDHDALVAWEERQRKAESALRELLGPAT